MPDLREVYGIDVGDPVVMERPWWWLRPHIIGLLDLTATRPTRINNIFSSKAST